MVFGPTPSVNLGLRGSVRYVIYPLRSIAYPVAYIGLQLPSMFWISVTHTIYQCNTFSAGQWTPSLTGTRADEEGGGMQVNRVHFETR